MTFQSLSFPVFLAAAVLVCRGLSGTPAAVMALELFCLAFYLSGGGWAALAVLAAGVAVTRTALGALSGPHRRRNLVLACCYHAAVLAVFKYAGFFTGGARSLDWAPMGLSFFTFQQLWLLRDVYTGDYRPAGGEPWPLFALFFPTVASGPILRAGEFFPQLKEAGFLRPGARDAAAGLYALCWGTVKKVLLADPLGTVVANGWSGAERLSAPEAWLVMLAYTLQLYLDFSGYCDIASGAARLLGVRLPVNFDVPYRSLSVGEFWKRWHRTLTSFLRQCVYFPLGGSRKGPLRTYRNILVVYLVSGWWHGAGWTFLVWGLLHGLAQIAERAWGPGRERLPGAVRWAGTFLFVNVAWVFFRAPDLHAAGAMLSAAVSGGLRMPGEWLLEGFFDSETAAAALAAPDLPAQWLLLGAVMLAGLAVSLMREEPVGRMDTFRPVWWRGAVLAVLTAWSVLSFTGITGFIYSNF